MDNNKHNDPPTTSATDGTNSYHTTAAPAGNDPQKQLKIRKYVKMLWGILAAIVLGTILMFAGFSWGWFGFMPTFDELENPQTHLASEIYSIDSVLLGTYYIENRSPAYYSDISP